MPMWSLGMKCCCAQASWSGPCATAEVSAPAAAKVHRNHGGVPAVPWGVIGVPDSKQIPTTAAAAPARMVSLADAVGPIPVPRPACIHRDGRAVGDRRDRIVPPLSAAALADPKTDAETKRKAAEVIRRAFAPSSETRSTWSVRPS